jgi:hypothetical protein
MRAIFLSETFLLNVVNKNIAKLSEQNEQFSALKNSDKK